MVGEPAVALRPARDDDLEFTYQVKKAAEGELVRSIYGWVEGVQRDFQKKDFTEKRPCLVVVEGKPVGTVAIIECDGYLEVGQFFIAPENQNRGIGSCILERAVRQADEKKLTARLAYLRGNRAEALYRRFGFELVGSTETHRYMERPARGSIPGGNMDEPLSYSTTGVDIDSTDAAKRRMAGVVDSGDPRVLNRLGAFASIVEGSFPNISHPVLVLKTDEPGSKQKLALELGRIESLCEDLVNHLLNDVAVMGAHPLYVLDCIVCGQLDSNVVHRLVAGMAAACRSQGAVLVGGETSVQPGVVPGGLYVLSATAIGVAERDNVVDGSAVRPGDAVLAVASNGLHTNGYSIVRALLDRQPDLAGRDVGGESFLDAVMRPHTCYYLALRDLFGRPGLHGLAHITGGGLHDNLIRVLPSTVDVTIDLALLRVLEIFRLIQQEGRLPATDMLRTFNLGCGLIAITDPDAAATTIAHFEEQGHRCWRVGEATTGAGRVRFTGDLPL